MKTWITFIIHIEGPIRSFCTATVCNSSVIDNYGGTQALYYQSFVIIIIVVTAFILAKIMLFFNISHPYSCENIINATSPKPIKRDPMCVSDTAHLNPLDKSKGDIYTGSSLCFDEDSSGS